MRKLLFSVDLIELLADNRARVGGRCCADAIHKGDVASYMVMLDQLQNEVQSIPTRIDFIDIEAYKHRIDTIEPGITAGVCTSAELAAELKLGWYLAGENA
jgi:hypothetical protein